MTCMEIAVNTANDLVRKYSTRNPEKIADEMNIQIVPMPFSKQKGVYTIIERQPIIMIKQDLHPVTRSIVIAHELGHHMLHKAQLKKTPNLQEFNIFDMTDNHIEYEANVFAAQLLQCFSEIGAFAIQTGLTDIISKQVHVLKAEGICFHHGF